jgi:hypothetical protein
VIPWQNQRDPPSYLPVRALLQLGQHMLVSGGATRPGSAPSHRLQLWDCEKQKLVQEFPFRCECWEQAGLYQSWLDRHGGTGLQGTGVWRTSGGEQAADMRLNDNLAATVLHASQHSAQYLCRTEAGVGVWCMVCPVGLVRLHAWGTCGLRH